MRVLHINNNYIFTALHQNMIVELEAQGIDNDVFAPVSNASAGVIQPIGKAHVISCFGKYDRLFFHNKQRKIRAALEKCLDVKSYNCIHGYTLFTDGYCAMQLSKAYGIPYVVAVRNTDVNTFFRYMPHLRSTGVEILLNASKVFFLSKPYQQQVLNRYVPEGKRKEIAEKSQVIPNGIDDFWLENVFASRNYEEAAKRFADKELHLIFAGRIDRNKNIGLTIEAMRILAGNGWNVCLDVVGPIGDRSVYDEIKAEPNVTVTPKQPKEKLIVKYREADLFVMPSHKESFGLVYAEAMSQGLPVLYTKGQGFDGQFPEGEAGYAVDDNSPEDVAEKIGLVLNRYREISESCPEKIRKYRWRSIARQYKEIYTEVAGDVCR